MKPFTYVTILNAQIFLAQLGLFFDISPLAHVFKSLDSVVPSKRGIIMSIFDVLFPENVVGTNLHVKAIYHLAILIKFLNEVDAFIDLRQWKTLHEMAHTFQIPKECLTFANWNEFLLDDHGLFKHFTLSYNMLTDLVNRSIISKHFIDPGVKHWSTTWEVFIFCLRIKMFLKFPDSKILFTFIPPSDIFTSIDTDIHVNMWPTLSSITVNFTPFIFAKTEFITLKIRAHVEHLKRLVDETK